MLRRQGRRSLRDKGGTCPPIFGPGGNITSVPPLSEESMQVKLTISVPFNHVVAMVKIRGIFQLILAVYFMAFYFTKTHILL